MKLKRVLASILCFAMVLSAMGTVAFAEETAIENTTVAPEDVLTTGENYSTVYYGGIPWRVLDKEFSDGQENAKDGIYLLSEYAYGHGTFWNAHYGPGDYVWDRTGIFTRLDVLYHENGYEGNGSNTHPTNLGYQASDIRKYMTGIGEYEAVYPRSMHEHGNPDNSGLNVSSYFWKTKVTDTEPTPGVEYYVKGDFKLSNCEFNNYETLSVTAEDWLPDTWYTYDAETDTYNLVEEAPAEGETLICYHDATEYYKVGELDSFEDGVDYYTFEKISEGMPEWEYTKLEMQANSIAKGALYVAFTVTDMKESTSADVEGEGRVILSGENNRSFATDMGFSEIEQAAVLPVNRTGYTNGAAKAPSVWTYKNSAAYSDEFVNDTYFLPTAADLNTYLDDNGISKATTFANGDSAQYWISSMTRYDRVGMVDGGGGEWYQHPTMKSLGIRPAFVLNPDAVQFYAPVEDVDFAPVEENTNNAYKLVLKDDSRSDFAITPISMEDSVVIQYSGAATGNNEYISAVVYDEYNNIVAYGKVAEVTGESGTVEFDLSGIDMTDKKLYLFNEQCNGEGETNYASDLAYVGKVEVDGVLYDSLQEAVDIASDGATITVLLDVELSAQDANAALKPAYNRESYAGLIIPDDKKVTIDLNGKTISYVDEYLDCDNVAIINLGDLTINDTVGDGKITYKPVAGSTSYTYFYSTIFNCGTLTVNGGIIENTCDTATDVTNAVDNHSRLSHEYDNDCILVVNGGTLIGSEYRAIRQYTHYFEGVKNRVEINAGTVKGGIYMQHGDSWYYASPESNRLNVNCELEITGGNIVPLDDGYGHIRSRLSNPDNAEWSIAINGGNIQVPVELQVQRGVYYTNGVSGATTPTEATGARNTEWLEKNGGFISGGTFTDIGVLDDVTTNLQSFVAEGFELQRTGADLYTVVETDGAEDALTADTISIEYKNITAADAEGEKVYEIIVKANGDDEIHELASVDLSFAFSTTPVVDGNMEIVVLPATDFTLTRYENSDRYMFNYNGTSAWQDSGNAIPIGTITVTGYGNYTISTDNANTNIVNATTLQDNLVDFYVANGAEDDDLTTGGLVINEDTVADDGLVGKVESDVIAVPVRNLAVTIDFPNAVTDNVIAYQDMKVVISGGDLAEDIIIDLGSDAAETPIVIDGKVDAKYAAAMVDGSYVINVTDALTVNNAYTVTVSGAGYRTARYTVTMTEDKALRFWNNVMDEAQVVEIGKDSSAVNVTFLAGDIVKDNKINIYDLSAVVSYFGTETDTTAYDAYAKYDLNRDGVVDSKDVAYVLVSWDN